RDERAADDGALGAGAGERGDVVRGADAAGGEHAQARRRDLAHELEVRAREGAVAVDRGAEDAGHARVPAPARGLGEGQAGGGGPAGGADLAVADVERDDEALAELGPRR